MEKLQKEFTASITITTSRHEIQDQLWNTIEWDDKYDELLENTEDDIINNLLTDEVCQEYIDGYILVKNDEKNNDGYALFHINFFQKIINR